MNKEEMDVMKCTYYIINLYHYSYLYMCLINNIQLSDTTTCAY